MTSVSLQALTNFLHNEKGFESLRSDSFACITSDESTDSLTLDFS